MGTYRRLRFDERHIGIQPGEEAGMLEVIGEKSLDSLLENTIPANIRTASTFDLPEPMSEEAALARLRHYASMNKSVISMIGQGYYGTIMPSVIQRNVLENPSWYTAYTPYQPEISQGRLEGLLNFQQMICDLTDLEIANASLLDEATAAAEAMTMMHRHGRGKKNKILVDHGSFTQTRAVMHTRASGIGIEIETVDFARLADECAAGTMPDASLFEGCFGVFIQIPNRFGRVYDAERLIKAIKEYGVMVAMASDLMALTMIKTPGEMGADIALGSAQRFGVPMGFGGPHAAFFATREAFKRVLPGRIIGVSVDSKGHQALRMALQTREQHIRRDKATSNICTAQALLAIISGFYGCYHGGAGVHAIGGSIHQLAMVGAMMLKTLGLQIVHHHFFDTICVRLEGRAATLVEYLQTNGINLHLIDKDHFCLSIDETHQHKTLRVLRNGIADFLGIRVPAVPDPDPVYFASVLPDDLQRKSDFMTHPVFNLYRSETELMRYLRGLAHKDLSLDRTMIPLGSCTMKLNATSEMLPVSWPEFANIHPFAPLEQTHGYSIMLQELSHWLCQLTGFAAISMQPNSGAQGEYSGLMAIRGYHLANGEPHRTKCLIPTSAHGTNPASAVMAGFDVIAISCEENGNIDMQALRAKVEEHKGELGALMITYPSTFGVFEPGIVDICDLIHEHGGQVYMDGANFNAMVGLCKPGEFGADVMHLNLHKTFCIPHGGGGPGMGPIGVRAHLAPHLPDHIRPDGSNLENCGAVAASAFSSALILTISWTYIAMMGLSGLQRATTVAILNANYIATRLAERIGICFTGESGRVAHECILDLRNLKSRVGLGVEDLAKRLIDYGFHAPTMSWPVAETLMVEPTESESRHELDRFCDAMISIMDEIDRVEAGSWPNDDNPLCNAPHTLEDALVETWAHAYSRGRAAAEGSCNLASKYWSPVSRVDNAYGDRNLICTCPPMEAYEKT
ncbi:MAG: aminomethyl-transferring glycine dehydrogenase [Pseudomonadota bacterium]